MIKKILLILLFLNCGFFYSQDLDKYNAVLSEIDEVETKIMVYSDTNYEKISVPENLIKDFIEDGGDEANIPILIESYKKSKLRSLFFNENPKYLEVYKQLSFRDSGSVTCVNPGFELLGGSTFSYEFFQHEFGNPIVFDACNMEINTNIPIVPGPLNSMSHDVALVSNGFDPVLSSQTPPIYLCRTNNGCSTFTERAIRLNRNHGDRDITIMRKNLDINGDFFVFNFASVMTSGHSGSQQHLQPFFQIVIYDENGDVYTQRCIIADANDCNFISVEGDVNLLYSPWACVRLDTSGLIGQNVNIDFIVSDCGLTMHYGYVYIDDLCQEFCHSGFGFIDLFPLEEGGTCPEFPIEVCGEFIPPFAGTVQQGILTDIWLDILQNDMVVGTSTDVTVTGFDFCFNVQESDFTVPLEGDFEFKVTAEFEMNCNINPYYMEISDTSTNIGPDISCPSLWPRTYGGDDGVNRHNFDIAVDEEENVYVLGSLFDGAYSYEDSSFLCDDGLFLMKHNKLGVLQWIVYLPDNVSESIAQMPFMEYANGKLIILTNKNYLLGYNLDGTVYFAPYQLAPPQYSLFYTKSLDTNPITGDIYLSIKFDASFNNGFYHISVAPGETKYGIFKFNPNGTYHSHQEIWGNDNEYQIVDITHSQSLDKLFVSGTTNIGETVHFSILQSVTDSSFGVEYDTSSAILFDDVTDFSTSDYAGLLEFDNDTDDLFLAYGDHVYLFNGGFFGIPSLISSGVFYNLYDLSFNQQTNKLLVASNFNVGAVNSSGLVWSINTTPVLNFTIASGNDSYIYVNGYYIGNQNLGGFPLFQYGGIGNSAMFIARVEDSGTSGTYKIISQENTPITIGVVEKSYLLYPNPVNQILNILPKKENTQIRTVTLYDISGAKSKWFDNNSESNIEPLLLDMTDIKSGIYIVEIKNINNEIEYYKVMKQ